MGAVYWGAFLLLGSLVGIVLASCIGWYMLPTCYAVGILLGFVLHPNFRKNRRRHI